MFRFTTAHIIWRLVVDRRGFDNLPCTPGQALGGGCSVVLIAGAAQHASAVQAKQLNAHKEIVKRTQTAAGTPAGGQGMQDPGDHTQEYNGQ